MGKRELKTIVFGSLNLDHVYHVDHVVHPKETLQAVSYQINPGGKGLNQAIALAKAGSNVSIAGKIGQDGLRLKEVCKDASIQTDHLIMSSEATGSAIVQVTTEGENAIIVYGGANQTITQDEIMKTLDDFQAGDYLIVQNETNLVSTILKEAKKRELICVVNPSPYTEACNEEMLLLADWLILNEIELCQITKQKNIDMAWKQLCQKYSQKNIVLTLGENGSQCFVDGKIYSQKAYPCHVVDTTAAGDTFTGYFFSSIEAGEDISVALKKASLAASMAVSCKGACESIPYKTDIEKRYEYED